MAETYELMNKDRVVLRFEASQKADDFPVSEMLEPDGLPFGFTDMRDFLAQRRAPKHRAHIERLLRLCQCDTLWGFLNVTHALSLNDTFWCRPADSDLCWGRVSLFHGEFNEVIARIAFEGGLRGEVFSSTSPEFSTDGSFAKCWKVVEGRISLLKTGSRGTHNSGLEPYSEVLACQLGRALGLPTVDYALASVRDREGGRRMPASLCSLFTSEDVGFVPARRLLETPYPSMGRLLELYEGVGAGEQFRRLIVLDAIAVNPDRHIGNHGMLFDANTLKLLGMAPVFDNNMALCPYACDSDLDDLPRWAAMELRPKIGDDFNLVAHALLTPPIRRDLRDLSDFRFDRTKAPNFPAERFDALEELVHTQVIAVLKGTPFNRERPMSEADSAELLKQLEGWPDDDALRIESSSDCL